VQFAQATVLVAGHQGTATLPGGSEDGLHFLEISTPVEYPVAAVATSSFPTYPER
jgi:hypothetical protein